MMNNVSEIYAERIILGSNFNSYFDSPFNLKIWRKNMLLWWFRLGDFWFLWYLEDWKLKIQNINISTKSSNRLHSKKTWIFLVSNLIHKSVTNNYIIPFFSKYLSDIKGTLVQIWKSPYMYMFIGAWYSENFPFLILRTIDSFTLKVCIFLYNLYLVCIILFFLYVCKQTYRKLYGQKIWEILGLWMQNFQSIIFIVTRT